MKSKKFRSPIIVIAVMALVAGAAFVALPARAGQVKEFTAEQIAETVIVANGSRPLLNQIRRNGVERGRQTRMAQDGHSEEAHYELRFVRGDKAEKDKVRVDNKTPQAEYSLINSEGRIFGIINGSPFTPRADATADFISQQAHSIDALLRYKENDSKLASAVKYSKRFYDYRVAQGTLVPYRTVLSEDGKPTMETRISTVTYGVKMEDSLFQNPEAASSGNP